MKAIRMAAVVLAAVALAPDRAVSQELPFVALRSTLQELREARQHLKDARDVWPPGYKDRAMTSTQAAMDSIKTIMDALGAKDFKGLDRAPEYYEKYSDHRHLRAAVADLRESRDFLRTATVDFRGHKDKAMDDIDIAVGDILTLIRHGKK